MSTSLVARARRHGVRIIGPSSMGVATSHREIGLEAALVPVELSPGSIAIVMQSGSLGASLLRLAQRLDMGLSWFVSLGDRSDVSGNDLLQFWDDDDSTNVIAMYNETLGNTHRFARIARRVSLRRPIVAVRTGAAAIAPSGGALYQHSGLIEVPSVTAMLDTARVLATQPLLRGRRVAVVSNSRSPATARRSCARRRRSAGGHGAGDPRLDRHVGGLPHGDRRGGRIRRRRRRARHPRPADP